MKKTPTTNAIILILTLFSFLGCNDNIETKQETVTEKALSPEILSQKNLAIDSTDTQNISEKLDYGEYTLEIETLLSVTPLGAEIYLEEQEEGEWYLKIEKTFTTQSQDPSQKVENPEPIYAESILI